MKMQFDNKSKIAELRALVADVVDNPPPIPEAPLPPKRRIYKDDFGNVLTEEQHKIWLGKKETAKAKGYVIDEFSQ